VNIPARYEFVLLAQLVLVVIVPHEALAQEARSFQELQALLHVDDEVRVTEVSGAATEGKLIKLSDSSLRLRGFQRDVPSSQISRIERIKKDPLSNGIGIGMLVGLGTGAVLIKSGCGGKGGDFQIIQCSDFPGAIAITLALSAAAGAGIGAQIDASFVKRESVYRASKPTSRLYIVPYITGRTQSVQLILRF